MSFLRRHRVPTVLVGLGVLVTLYVILEERFPRELARSEEHMPA